MDLRSVQRTQHPVEAVECRTDALDARFYRNQSFDAHYGEDNDDIEPYPMLGAVIVVLGFALTVGAIWWLVRWLGA